MPITIGDISDLDAGVQMEDLAISDVDSRKAIVPVVPVERQSFIVDVEDVFNDLFVHYLIKFCIYIPKLGSQRIDFYTLVSLLL